MVKKRHFLFINKTPGTKSLSRSRDAERARIFSHVQGQQSTALLSQPHSRNVNLESLLATYVQHNLNNYDVDPGLRKLPGAEWNTFLPSMRTASEAVAQSLTALVCAAASKTLQDQTLVYQGLRAYGRALISLQRDLSDSRRVTLDSTLCACAVLVEYQLYNPVWTQSDWRSHVDGMAKLVQLRSPSSFSRSMTLFTACRSLLAFDAAMRGAPIFLSDTAWREEPWIHEEKTMYHLVQDGPMLVAELRAHLDGCELAPSIETQQSDWHRKCQRVQLEISTYLDRFGWHPLGKVPTRLRMCGGQQESVAHLFPESFAFTSIRDPIILLVIWASLLELDLFVDELVKRVLGERHSSIVPELLWHADESHAMANVVAKNICMSIQYCASHPYGAGQRGQYFLIYAAKTAQQWFAHRPSMAQWASWCAMILEVLEQSEPLQALLI